MSLFPTRCQDFPAKYTENIFPLESRPKIRLSMDRYMLKLYS
jgi:hypothetical protein